MITDIIHEQGTGIHNEDVFLAENNIFGVFDGATSLDETTYKNGLTGGYFAAATAGNVFSKNNDSLVNLAINANSAIMDKMKENKVDFSDRARLWSTSAAVVRVLEDEIEWVQTGDSLMMIIYEDGSYKLPAPSYNHDTQTLDLWKTKSEETDKTIYDTLQEKIIETRRKMNIDYGVLNGETSFKAF